MTPTERTTPETYLGFARADDRYLGLRTVANATHAYRLPASLGQNEWAYGGTWRVEDERAIAGRRAGIGLHFHASKVYLVMGGHGRVGVSVDGRRLRTIKVGGISRLYTVISRPQLLDADLRLRFTPGIAVYSFTFG